MESALTDRRRPRPCESSREGRCRGLRTGEAACSAPVAKTSGPSPRSAAATRPGRRPPDRAGLALQPAGGRGSGLSRPPVRAVPDRGIAFPRVLGCDASSSHVAQGRVDGPRSESRSRQRSTAQSQALPPLHHDGGRLGRRKSGADRAGRQRPRDGRDRGHGGSQRAVLQVGGGDHRRAASGDAGRDADGAPLGGGLHPAHPADRPLRSPAQFGDRDQPGCADDRRSARPGAPRQRPERAAAWHPCPRERQLRHR